MCQTHRDIPQETWSCNCCKIRLYEVLRGVNIVARHCKWPEPTCGGWCGAVGAVWVVSLSDCREEQLLLGLGKLESNLVELICSLSISLSCSSPCPLEAVYHSHHCTPPFLFSYRAGRVFAQYSAFSLVHGPLMASQLLTLLSCLEFQFWLGLWICESKNTLTINIVMF